MENTIQHLLKIIAILYYNNKSGEHNDNLTEEINEYLKNVKVDPRCMMGLDGTSNVAESLRYTAEWMLNVTDARFDKELIISRLITNLQGNTDYIDSANILLNESLTEEESKKKVINLMLEIRFDKKKNELKTMIAKYNAIVNFNTDYWELKNIVVELMTKLEEIQAVGKDEVPGLVGEVDFTQVDFIEKALTKGVELNDVEGMLNTGNQYLNYTSGGGLKRGYLINFGALTHHYKTGLLIDMSINIPKYNNPWMWNSIKKPLILRISFETTIDQDIITIYKKLYECEFKKKYEATEINIDEASNFLKEYFQQNGYTFRILNYNPNEFCIYDLFNVLNKYINAGYEIHAVICDYLELITDNTFAERKDTKITKTYEMVRNYCYPKGITFITGAQLDTKAQEKFNFNKITYLNEIVDGGYYRDCKSLHHKLDLEYLLCVVKHSNGNSYLGMAMGKNRGIGIISPSEKKAYYQFQEIGGIVPDVNDVYRGIKQLPDLVNPGDTADDWE